MENIENFFKDLTTNFNKLIGFKENFFFRRRSKSSKYSEAELAELKKRLNKLIQKADQGVGIVSENVNITNDIKRVTQKAKRLTHKAQKKAERAAKLAKDAAKLSGAEAEEAQKKAEEAQKETEEAQKEAEEAQKEAEEAKRLVDILLLEISGSAEQADGSAQLADELAGQADESAQQADESAQQADESATDAYGNKTETDHALDQLKKSIVANNGVQPDSLDRTISRFQNIENFETIENSRTRAQEILNNPTKFNNFVSILENQIYANSENSKKTRLLQASELLTQKDTIASNIIMDYLYKNEKGTNVHKIYDRIDQLNDDKARKIEINTYYNKAYKEYINILKVIILVCIIIVPIVIANKNNMIPNSVTMFLVVAIIFLTVIFIIYKFSDIYMRDNKNFDKLRIPYDRELALLEKQGKITKKKNPLTSLTLTCIGQDCCDGSMVYDFAKNKCILSENFGGYFESMNNHNSGKTSYVEGLDGNINESFANCNIKQNLVANSLNCSDEDKFYSNDCSRRIQFTF